MVGATLTIRKFNTRHFQMDDLIAAGTLDRATGNRLEELAPHEFYRERAKRNRS